MNRTASILILTGVIAAAAGWSAAGINAHFREQKEARREAAAAEEKATRPAKQIPALIESADEAVITFLNASNNTRREVRITDPAWIKRLAAVTGSARYEPIGHLLRIYSPWITLYRDHQQVLYLEPGGRVLRALAKSGKGGDFIVGEAPIQAIGALIAEAEAAHPAIVSSLAAR